MYQVALGMTRYPVQFRKGSDFLKRSVFLPKHLPYNIWPAPQHSFINTQSVEPKWMLTSTLSSNHIVLLSVAQLWLTGHIQGWAHLTFSIWPTKARGRAHSSQIWNTWNALALMVRTPGSTVFLVRTSRVGSRIHPVYLFVFAGHFRSFWLSVSSS